MTYGHVQELPDGLVVPGTAVGHGQSVHPRSTEDGVLVGGQLLDERVGFLQTAVHREGDTHGEATQDFFVLALLGILKN